jgi:hypothetical protein
MQELQHQKGQCEEQQHVKSGNVRGMATCEKQQCKKNNNAKGVVGGATSKE